MIIKLYKLEDKFEINLGKTPYDEDEEDDVSVCNEKSAANDNNA